MTNVDIGPPIAFHTVLKAIQVYYTVRKYIETAYSVQNLIMTPIPCHSKESEQERKHDESLSQEALKAIYGNVEDKKKAYEESLRRYVTPVVFPDTGSDTWSLVLLQLVERVCG